MKPIFEYTDYREWIRDAFDDFKQRKTVISWRYMAMKLGADPGNLLRVSQGKIHLTLSLVKPMAEFFELDEKETAYWTELVCFGRAKTDAEALNHYEKMQILKGIPLKINLNNNKIVYDKIGNYHYHMQCYKCNDVFDISIEKMPYMKDLDDNLNNIMEEKIINHDIVFSCICKKCIS